MGSVVMITDIKKRYTVTVSISISLEAFYWYCRQ